MVTVSTRDVKHHSPMKFIGIVFSAARAWLQATTPTATTKTTRNILAPLKMFRIGKELGSKNTIGRRRLMTLDQVSGGHASLGG
jgi:hypothetical protein